MSNKDLGKVIAIQIAPWKPVADGSPEGSIEIQPDGADQDTEGYGVYARHENGMAIHRRDFVTEAAAVVVARELCKEFGVKVEPYGWQVGLVHMGPTVIVDDTKAFESFARKQDFIKDTQRYDLDHPDKNYAGKYGHYDTRNAKVMWDGAVAWTLAVLGYSGMSTDYLNGGDIRVTIEGRTGRGKSALAGILCEKLKSLGIPVTWNEQAYEEWRQDRTWETELQELCIGGTIKIVEKNLVPSQVAERFVEFKDGEIVHVGDKHFLKIDDVSQTSGHKGVKLQPEPDHKQLLLVRQAVESFLSMNMFHLEGSEEQRAAQFESIKRVLISRLWDTFPGVTMPDEPAYFIGREQVTKEQYEAAGQSNNGMKSSIDYPGPDGEQQ
ncbi:hypothetical protein AVU38_gp127 [Ralstonia phage RSL2]|uniref:Uncharacterized protein n=1 Tax=Ralstonia phage RSL2 TaxID=1585840 RepID=A0A0A8J8B6_9CAUD|nr:hypothetical protein AVU38_gp127 [Ralstonia phage RSL2]BAQ02655.1 hypothetical protein [Ralstonia phage RSL2]